MGRRVYARLHPLIILLCIGCVALAIVYYLRNKEGFQDTESTLDLVVARYQEDISWIKNIPNDIYDRVIIYNKGDDTEFNIDRSEVRKLPNLGRESHTYLSHVVDNYDNLADLTFFVPGSAWYRDDKKKRVLRISDYLKNGEDSYIIGHKNDGMINDTYNFSIDTWTVTNEANRQKNPDSTLVPSNDRPLRNWFEKRFPNEKLKCVTFTGILVVSREDIQKRPVEFYKELLQEHSHTNPEVVHYSERVWKNIFSIDDKNCVVE